MKLTNDKWLRAAKRIAMCILAMALPWMAHAQAVSTTTVQGTVYLANGQPGAGTLQLSWPAFTTAANQAIAAGRTTVTIGADGFVSVNLAPNLGSWPAGLYYTAVYYMSDGTTSTEYWVVPAAAQATIAQVRAQVMPAAQALQAVNKAYVDQAILSATQSALSASGGTLTGPLYLSSDPTQTMQAADKHYVDITFGQAVPLTGGTLTGPINAPALNASVNGQINIMAPGLGASDNTCTGDDTAALLAAQALARTFAINGVRPATIYFPPGCYNISPTSGWWQGVSMTGGGSPASNGSHGVIIKQTVPGADVISAVDPSQVTSTYFNSSWSISHLTLVVNDGTPTVTHPHRWPGRWFDDASMTAGSPVLKTTNGGVTCGDTGQAISVGGAGSSGALVTTILSVYPCWAQSGSAWQKITLAANAVNTAANAHTYISVANLPVTANIGAAGIALDGFDGKQADWPSGSVNTSSSYSHIDDVTVVSASYANHGQNNSVGIYTQGYNINYAIKVHNSNFNRLTFGIVQQTAELNSYNASSNGDYQSWRDIQTNGDDVPFIAVNGETTTLDNWENNSNPIGFQVYRMTNTNGDTPDGWVLSNISGGGGSATTLGWNVAGNNWTVTDVALGSNAYINTTYSAFTNTVGYSPNLGGNSNVFLGGNQFTGTQVNGSLGSVATIPGANSLGMPNSKYFPMIPYKGSNHLAGRFTADFIADGNPLTAPYNHDDLFIWPSDMMFNPSGSPQWAAYYTADSTATTGATFNFVSGGLGGSNFQQFDGPGGTGGLPVIGTNVPQKNLDITLSAKCDSATTYGFKAAVFGGTATYTATGSCTTSFQTISFVLPVTSADLTHNLYFAGTTANNFRVQWIDIQPQTNADTASALSAASALPGGTTATTQTTGDNTTRIATDAFVAANGSGTVNNGTANQIAYFGATGAAVSGNSHLTDNGAAITSTEQVAIPTSCSSGTTGSYCPPTGAVLASNVMDARYIVGVDCSGATDSSTALNDVTSVQDTLTNKTLSFKGCSKIQLQNQWLIHGQESAEIDLGGSWRHGSGGTQGGTDVFGCAGAAGPLVRVDLSGYINFHGGAIEAKGGSCSSNFTQSLQFTNSGSGGYTSTAGWVHGVTLSSNLQAQMVPNYIGFEIYGNPNQEEFTVDHVDTECYGSLGSIGFRNNDNNADSTWITNSEANCAVDYQNDAGVVFLVHDEAGEANYSYFGSNAALLKGPFALVERLTVADGSGTLLKPNSAGQGGAYIIDTGDGGPTDTDPNAYFIDPGNGNIILAGPNQFALTTPVKNNTIIGEVSGSSWGNAGLLEVTGTQTFPSTDVLVSQLWSDNTNPVLQDGNVFLTWHNPYGIPGTNTGWGLLPGWPTPFSNTGSGSSALSFVSNHAGTGNAQVQDFFKMGSNGVGNSKMTLTTTYTPPPSMTITPSIALQPALSGISGTTSDTAVASTFSTPAISPAGTAGSTTYSYVFVGLAGCGHSAPSATYTTTTGNATLSSTNYNNLNINQPFGTWGYDVYRTVGGATQGKIGTSIYSDTGLVGDGTTPPTTATSGCVQATNFQTIGTPTALSGTTAGSANWSQPQQGTLIKQAILYLNGYENTTATAQTIALPASYGTVSYVVTDGGSCTGVTVSGATVTLPSSMGATQTGLCEIKGY